MLWNEVPSDPRINQSLRVKELDGVIQAMKVKLQTFYYPQWVDPPYVLIQ